MLSVRTEMLENTGHSVCGIVGLTTQIQLPNVSILETSRRRQLKASLTATSAAGIINSCTPPFTGLYGPDTFDPNFKINKIWKQHS